MSLEADDGWWTTLYDAHLAAVLLRREVGPTVDFLVDVLRLRPGDRVFDQCCGIGSLAIPLAARGYALCGCDLGEGYAEQGRAEAAAQGLEVELVEADAFSYRPAAPCDAAFNWWTSFGYARQDAQNLKMLRRAFEALRPGARFALDTMNVPGVIAGFRPRVRVERDGLCLVRHSALDLEAGLMHKRWVYRWPDGRSLEHLSAVRLYTPWELRRLLAEAGFSAVEFFGNIDGQALGLDSPRCIAVATRGQG